MKKILISFSLFFLFSQIVFSQSFMNNFGVTLSFLQAKNPSTNSYENVFIQKLGTYFPKYNLSEKDNSSLSIGIPLSAGIGSINGDEGVFFSFDVPLMFDYNMGCNSTPDNESGFGGYAGLGFGYNYIGISDGYGGENMNSYGPVVHAGISFLISKSISRPLTLGAFYKLGMEEGKFRTFGINILY